MSCLGQILLLIIIGNIWTLVMTQNVLNDLPKDWELSLFSSTSSLLHSLVSALDQVPQRGIMQQKLKMSSCAVLIHRMSLKFFSIQFWNKLALWTTDVKGLCSVFRIT